MHDWMCRLCGREEWCDKKCPKGSRKLCVECENGFRQAGDGVRRILMALWEKVEELETRKSVREIRF